MNDSRSGRADDIMAIRIGGDIMVLAMEQQAAVGEVVAGGRRRRGQHWRRRRRSEVAEL